MKWSRLIIKKNNTCKQDKSKNYLISCLARKKEKKCGGGWVNLELNGKEKGYPTTTWNIFGRIIVDDLHPCIILSMSNCRKFSACKWIVIYLFN